MKIQKKHEQLRKDVAALRFINEQTGYNLDIRYTVVNRYRSDVFHLNYLQASLKIFADLGFLVVPTVAGIATGVFALPSKFPKEVGIGIGMVAGLTTGFLTHKFTLGQWERAYDIVRKARNYKEVYDKHGLEGLASRNMRFDEFLTNLEAPTINV